jgi:hypothetical protein
MDKHELYQKQFTLLYNAINYLADILIETGTPEQLRSFRVWRDIFTDNTEKLDAELEKLK